MKRLILIPGLLCFLTVLLAGQTSSHYNKLDPQSLSAKSQSYYDSIDFDSVHYEYQITTKTNGDLTITGCMEWIFKWPEGCKTYILYRSNPNVSLVEGFLGIAMTFSNPEDSVIHYVKENINYKTWYKGVALDSNNNRIETPKVCIRDLVKPEDIEIVEGIKTSITSPQKNEIDISKCGNRIKLQTQKPQNVFVYDLSGELLYSGIINGEHFISALSPIVILKYEKDNKVIIKKIQIQ